MRNANGETFKSILSFEVKENGETRVQVNTTNEPLLALALRRMGQVVDIYLAEQEAKAIQKSQGLVQATIIPPASVMDRLRG